MSRSDCRLTRDGQRAAARMAEAPRSGGHLVRPDVVAAGTPFEPLNSGGNRFVFVRDPGRPEDPFTGGECVLKLAQGPDAESNRREAAVWLTAPDDLRPWLMPVTDYAQDGAWIVQPRAERELTRAEYDGFSWRLTRDTDYRVGDLRRDNTGIHEGSEVVIDYGDRINEVGEGYIVDDPPRTLD